MLNPKTKYKTRTSNALLDSGEFLFGRKLYSDVTLEEIAKLAKCNVGQLVYHFGNKHTFLRACILRRAPILCIDRSTLLNNYIQVVGKNNVEIEPLLRAFIDPFFTRAMGSDIGWRNYARFLATIVWWENAAPIIAEAFDEAALPYLDCFQIALPNLTKDSSARCFQFLLATLYSSIVDDKRIEILTNGVSTSGDYQAYYEILIPFLAAGFKQVGHSSSEVV